jgi:hypothetical protein
MNKASVARKAAAIAASLRRGGAEGWSSCRLGEDYGREGALDAPSRSAVLG